MGFFSWNCSISEKSIPAYPYAKRPIEESEVVLLLPSGKLVKGVYDGYGTISGVDIFEAIIVDIGRGVERDDFFKEETYEENEKLVKLVRQDIYSGESFWELKASSNCSFQGFFYP